LHGPLPDFEPVFFSYMRTNPREQVLETAGHHARKEQQEFENLQTAVWDSYSPPAPLKKMAVANSHICCLNSQPSGFRRNRGI